MPFPAEVPITLPPSTWVSVVRDLVSFRWVAASGNRVLKPDGRAVQAANRTVIENRVSKAVEVDRFTVGCRTDLLNDSTLIHLNRYARIGFDDIRPCSVNSAATAVARDGSVDGDRKIVSEADGVSVDD